MRNVNLKTIVASLAVSAAAMLPSNLLAQNYITIAGSSAMFNSMGYSSGDPALCGPNYWSYKSSGAPGSTTFAGIHDSRSGSIADEGGTLWITWNASMSKVCTFVQVDSTVGVRAAFAVDSSGNPAATVTLGSAVSGAANGNKLLSPNPSGVSAATLPAAVYSIVNGAAITVAAADIRAEDAKFATTRTLTAQGVHMTNTLLTEVTGLGYANSLTPGIGFSIKSSQSTVLANPVDFALFGSDPISGGPAVAYFKTFNVGAGPVVVFVNTTNSASGHLGDATLSNISTSTLSGFVDGTFSRSSDLFLTPGMAANAVKTYIREPLSGTMNTFEYNIPNNFRYLTSQENNVTNVTPSSGSSDNPLAQAGAVVGSGRFRTIGTGEMVATVISNADSLGYAFWGYGNFSGVSGGSVARYLTVDGIDPLYSSLSANPNGAGVFPLKSGGVYPVLSFPNVANGSYPAWTTFRLVATPAADSSVVQAFATAAQTNASVISDFIPASSLNVFHSHFYTSQISGANGHVLYSAGPPAIYYSESGGDMGGQVFPIQNDYDYIADHGGTKELINRHQ